MFIYIKLEGYFVGFVINQKLHLHIIKTYQYCSSRTNIHTVLHIYYYRFHMYTSIEPFFLYITFFVKHICHNNFCSFFPNTPPKHKSKWLRSLWYSLWLTHKVSVITLNLLNIMIFAKYNKYKCSRRIQAW